MKQKKGHGLFITFEGIDGCGKTTQIMLAHQYLTSKGLDIKLLREPGSTTVAERIRDILLDRRLAIGDLTELLLYQSARAELTRREITPWLEKEKVVLCDRFFDSTTAYQGFGRKLDVRMVRQLHRIVVGSTVPDLTLLFDIDPNRAFQRRTGRADRLESQSKAFFTRVRNGFLEIARKERARIKVVDATQPIDKVFADTQKIIDRKLKVYVDSLV